MFMARARFIPPGLANIFLDPKPPWLTRRFDAIKVALFTEIRQINLKPVSKLQFTFDPFHPEVRSIREYLYYISADKYRATNPKCSLKTEIVCNREEPIITASLENGQKVIFKTALLTTLEIAQHFNRITLALIEKSDDLLKPVGK